MLLSAPRTLKVPVFWNSSSLSQISVLSPKISLAAPVCQRHTGVRRTLPFRR
jgi:hypothetical protein